MLDEAINSHLPEPKITPSSIDERSFIDPPLSPPPKAHYPSTMTPQVRPRLVSQLTRHTLPTSSLSYASVAPRRSFSETIPHAESSKAAQRRSLSGASFPDLDPTTGLPLSFSGEEDPEARTLHLQRTITDLLKSPSASYLPSVSVPTMSMPALPSIPKFGLPSLTMQRTDSRRSISTSASQNDWNWTGWWGGNKSKVDRQLTEDDQADTVEEEQDKHRRKCELTSPCKC